MAKIPPFYKASAAQISFKPDGGNPKDRYGWQYLGDGEPTSDRENVGPVELGSDLKVTQASTTATCTVRWNVSDLLNAVISHAGQGYSSVIIAQVSVAHRVSISYDLDEQSARQLPLAKHHKYMRHLKFFISPSKLKAPPGWESIGTVDMANHIKSLLSDIRPRKIEAHLPARRQQPAFGMSSKREREEEIDKDDIERLEATWREKVAATEEVAARLQRAQKEEREAKQKYFTAFRGLESGGEVRKKRG
ncbi:MAG: hypothetical protein Q9222_003243 [Ikaeria aurantiellina]